mgnify:CR=1 FL=1
MKRNINYLGLLSLLSLIGILGLTGENSGLFGFFGFLYYLRYFWIMCSWIYGTARAVPIAFALSFVATVFAFTIALIILEVKEQRGAAHD